jgi:hypothetical protein
MGLYVRGLIMTKPAPLTTPDNGYEICYECDGKRVCWSCGGAGVRDSGRRCNTCTGSGWCIVCGGAGQLQAGARAKYGPDAPTAESAGKRVAKNVGCFLDLGYDGAPALADVRGKREPAHQAQVVAYLKAGRVLVMSPGLVRDVFDRNTVAGSRSIRTDGEFAWPDSLAYYVERHSVELPKEFEEHMAARRWEMPHEIDIEGLVPG